MFRPSQQQIKSVQAFQVGPQQIIQTQTQKKTSIPLPLPVSGSMAPMAMAPMKDKKTYVVTAVTTKSGGKKGVQNTGSKFKSKTPSSAAKKAASRICSKSKIKGRCALNITIQQIDSSSNAVGKPMHYHVLRTKTTSPVAVDHAGNEILHKYTLTAKRIYGDLPHNRTTKPKKKKAKVVVKKVIKKIKVPKNKNVNVNINITKQMKQQTPVKKMSGLPLQPIIVQKKPLFQQQKQLSLPPILQEQTQIMRTTSQKPQQPKMMQIQKSSQMIQQQQKKPQQQMIQVQKSSQLIQQQQKKPQQQTMQIQKSGQTIQQQKKPQQQIMQAQKSGQMIQQQKKPQQQIMQAQKIGVQQQAPKKRGFFF